MGSTEPLTVRQPIRLWRSILPGILYLVLLGGLTWVGPIRHSGNVWSRYMTIESIVERGTLIIEDSPLLGPSGTPDLAKFRGHLYSDKPPVLSALGALIYFPVERLGYRMSGGIESLHLVNFLLVTTLVGLPSALGINALRRMLQTVEVPRWFADLAVVFFGLGSLLPVYGVTFNNHSPAAGLVTVGVGLVLLDRSDSRSKIVRWSFVGFLVSLAATIDLPTGGLFWIGLAGWLFRKSRNAGMGFLIGTIPPLLLHVVLQSSVTGSPLPVEFYPEAIEFDGSYWKSTAGQFIDESPRIWFLLEFLVGPQGWLTITPILFLTPIGLILLGLGRRDALRPLAVLVFINIVVLVWYYSYGVRRTDFSGASFGTRHLLAITPIAFFFTIGGLERLRFGAWKLLVVGFCLIGMVYSYYGILNPWSRVETRNEPALILLQRFVLYPYSSYRR